MERAWRELHERMGELRDLEGIVGLLTWDQETFLPEGGLDARAKQLASLQAIVHQKLTCPGLAEVLDAVDDASLDETRRAMVRNLRRERERAAPVPADLIRELAERQSRAVEAWRVARDAQRFSDFAPHLEALLRLRRELADAIGFEGERYDALLEGYEPGMSTARLEPLFAELRKALIPLVEALAEAPQPRYWRVEEHRYPVEKQWEFTLYLLDRMGFDSTRGRQDRSTHPFTGGSSRDDVRLTTRLDEETPFAAIFGTIHEGGHGLYEQNLPEAHQRDVIGYAPSLGLHESQSRLWENMIGRSLPFWEAHLPELRRHFPEALAGVTAEEVYAAASRVERSPIRVEADEVTYNLHILLRFELELALFRGELEVADLPDAWNERMERYLGIRPKNDAEGVLQDIHWAWAEFGYFPTYTLGNLYAAIFYEKMASDLGDLEARIRADDLHAIRDWLVANVHQAGHRWDAEELVRRTTGRGLSLEPFLTYLKQKFGALYRVDLAA